MPCSSSAQARQLVSHKGVTVNGEKVNIPSYQLKSGDEVAVRDKAREQLRIKSAMSIATQVGLPASQMTDPTRSRVQK